MAVSTPRTSPTKWASHRSPCTAQHTCHAAGLRSALLFSRGFLAVCGQCQMVPAGQFLGSRPEPQLQAFISRVVFLHSKLMLPPCSDTCPSRGPRKVLRRPLTILNASLENSDMTKGEHQFREKYKFYSPPAAGGLAPVPILSTILVCHSRRLLIFSAAWLPKSSPESCATRRAVTNFRHSLIRNCVR